MPDTAQLRLTSLRKSFGGFEAIKGVDLTVPHKAAAKLAIGTKVITRFAEKRTGDVLDFWFELAA